MHIVRESVTLRFRYSQTEQVLLVLRDHRLVPERGDEVAAPFGPGGEMVEIVVKHVIGVDGTERGDSCGAYDVLFRNR
jgi:hypothetical protein